MRRIEVYREIVVAVLDSTNKIQRKKIKIIF